MSTPAPPAVIPLYVKIAAEMRDQIQDGTYAPGSLLPSRNEITQMYGVSAITARDALSIICQEGLAKAVRGRGHIVRRQRSRMTVPSRLYDTAGPNAGVALNLRQVDVYQETPPDNIALPLESGDRPVWVRRAVWAAADRQPVQIHVSWIPGLPDDAGDAIRDADPAAAWPQAVQQLTGRRHHRSGAAHARPPRQPFRGRDPGPGRRNDRGRRPPDALRRQPHAGRALAVDLACRCRAHQ